MLRGGEPPRARDASASSARIASARATRSPDSANATGREGNLGSTSP